MAGLLRAAERKSGSGHHRPWREARAPRRYFCPLRSCPCSDPTRARGWLTLATLRHHVDAHLAGGLAGEIPADWMQANHLQRCTQCGLSVSTRVGTHPSCAPAAQAAGAGAAASRDSAGAAANLPNLAAIQAARTATLRHVPSGTKHLWGQVLTRTLAAVVHFNDVLAWKELLMLPQSVLCAPPRIARRHKRAVAAYTLDRLNRWVEGERASLWASRPAARPHSEASAEARLDLALALGREGLDRKACSALLSQGLCAETPDNVQALRDLHPKQRQPAVSCGSGA